VALVEELGVALGSLTVLRAVGRDPRRDTRAAALAFYPAVGLLVGAVASAVAAALDPRELAGAAGVVVILALTAGRTSRALAHGSLGVIAAAAAVASKLCAVTTLPPPARTAALCLAPMLGRWAIVVQCYGGVPAAGEPASLVARARFREFGWASLTAFAVTLAVADAAGLVVLVVAALTTVALRVVAHRRLGGLTDGLATATGEIVETAVLLAFALLAAGREPGAALAAVLQRP